MLEGLRTGVWDVELGNDTQALIDAAVFAHRGAPLGPTKALLDCANIESGDYFDITIQPDSGDAVTYRVAYLTSEDPNAIIVLGGESPAMSLVADVIYQMCANIPEVAAHSWASVFGWGGGDDYSGYFSLDGGYIVAIDIPTAQASRWNLTLADSVYYPDTCDPLLFVLGPGHYKGGIRLYNGTYLTGQGDSSIVDVDERSPYHAPNDISLSYAISPNGEACYGVQLGCRRSGISGLKLESPKTLFGSIGVVIGTDAPSDSILIDRTRIEVCEYAVLGGRGKISNSRVKDISGYAAQVMYTFCPSIGVGLEDWGFSLPADRDGGVDNCYGLFDLLAPINCTIKRMSFRAYNATNSSGYMARVGSHGGSGNIIDDIYYESWGPGSEGLSIIQQQVFQEAGLDTHVSRVTAVVHGTNILHSTIGVSGRFGKIHLNDLKFAGTKSGGFTADLNTGGNAVGDVVLQSSIHTNGALTLAANSIPPVGWAIGEGAGLTAALLDTAFCGTGNRPSLVGWFRGMYTNTSDSNKVYEAWTDGTSWYTALQTVST